MNQTISTNLFKRAQSTLVGGVNSPVRAFKAMSGDPVFFDAGQGAYVWDVDGNRYIDYVGSWGPLILGHAHPGVVAKVKEACEKGFTFGAPTEIEIKLAEKVIAAYPSIERIRFVNSGTEAAMSAVRAARGFTGRHKVLKFEGCYHGHADGFLVKAGSGAATLGTPDSAGVTPGAAADTVTAVYNDLQSVRDALQAFPGEFAAIIVEPVVGNMGCVPPVDGFLETLREWTDKNNIVLIFDEVMTGFRIAYGGAQEKYKITPDMTVLGKIIGGGFPVGAYGGKNDIMNQIAPSGPVYQAGTLSGNPVAMTAGYETLCILSGQDCYQELLSKADYFYDEFQRMVSSQGYPVTLQSCGAMFCVYFTDAAVHNFSDVQRCDTGRFRQYFWHCLNNGVYFAPSQYEANFISLQHGEQELRKTVQVCQEAFRSVFT